MDAHPALVTVGFMGVNAVSQIYSMLLRFSSTVRVTKVQKMTLPN